jgi:hypothetical protein
MSAEKAPRTATPQPGLGLPLAWQVMTMPPFAQADTMVGVVLELAVVGGQDGPRFPGQGLGRRGGRAGSLGGLASPGRPGPRLGLI